ncbi:MAG: M20/M25/M40 family metallo-hydrolase [Nitrosomonas sp.]
MRKYSQPLIGNEHGSRNSRETLINSANEMKHEAHGTQQPRHINMIGEGASTAQRSDSLVQSINQRFPSAECRHAPVAQTDTPVSGNPGYPVTINSPDETASAIRVAIEVAGVDCVNTAPTPSMGAEDSAFMLQQKPGCYIWIGNGGSQGNCLLHNPNYDFNDEILPLGAAYWVKLVENELPG